MCLLIFLHSSELSLLVAIFPYFEKIIQQNPKTNSRYAIERNNKILKCLIELDQRVIPIDILKTKEDKVKECFKKKP